MLSTILKSDENKDTFVMKTKKRVYFAEDVQIINYESNEKENTDFEVASVETNHITYDTITENITATEKDIIVLNYQDSKTDQIYHDDQLDVLSVSSNEDKKMNGDDVECIPDPGTQNTLEDLVTHNTELDNIVSLTIASTQQHLKVKEESMDDQQNIYDSRFSCTHLCINSENLATENYQKTTPRIIKQTDTIRKIMKDNLFVSNAEANSAVFEAWIKIKCEKKNICTIIQSSSKQFNLKHPLSMKSSKRISRNKDESLAAFDAWCKKKSKKEKQIREKIVQDNIGNSLHLDKTIIKKEENDMAFKSWLKVKDEEIKKKSIEQRKIEEQKVLDSLKKQRSKEDSAAAFSAWKNNKEVYFKFRRSCKAEDKKNASFEKSRQKTSEDIYELWLNSKQNVQCQPTMNFDMNPPWYPPGKNFLNI